MNTATGKMNIDDQGQPVSPYKLNTNHEKQFTKNNISRRNKEKEKGKAKFEQLVK